MRINQYISFTMLILLTILSFVDVAIFVWCLIFKNKCKTRERHLIWEPNGKKPGDVQSTNGIGTMLVGGFAYSNCRPYKIYYLASTFIGIPIRFHDCYLCQEKSSHHNTTSYYCLGSQPFDKLEMFHCCAFSASSFLLGLAVLIIVGFIFKIIELL